MALHTSHITPGPKRVVGLDLSLTSTGASDGQSVHAFQTSATEVTEDRMIRLANQCVGFVLSPTQGTDAHKLGKRADLVCLEGAAFGAKGDAVDQLAGLRWLVRTRLRRLGVPVAIVSPTGLKAYTAGNGRATKAEMVRAVKERHGLDLGHVKLKDGRSDMADAFALAAMGYAHLGQPLPTTGPPPPMASLLAVKWPGKVKP